MWGGRPRAWQANPNPNPNPNPKARVKTDIFEPWTAADGPIDHQVALLYTEQIRVRVHPIPKPKPKPHPALALALTLS